MLLYSKCFIDTVSHLEAWFIVVFGRLCHNVEPFVISFYCLWPFEIETENILLKSKMILTVTYIFCCFKSLGVVFGLLYRGRSLDMGSGKELLMPSIGQMMKIFG